MTLVELGDDWERTEVLHKKFEEFQEELTARKGKVDRVNQYANECAQVSGTQKRRARERVLSLQNSFPTTIRQDVRGCDIGREWRGAYLNSNLP